MHEEQSRKCDRPSTIDGSYAWKLGRPVDCDLCIIGDLLCILGLEATVSRPGGGRGRVLRTYKFLSRPKTSKTIECMVQSFIKTD